MTKQKKLISGVISAIVLITILSLTYLQFTKFNSIPQIIRDLKGNDRDGSNVWDYLTKNGYKTVICKRDLMNPVNVTINKGESETSGGYAFYTNLTRNNIFSDFYTNDYQASVGSTNFTEKDIAKIANWYEQKGCDFFKQNGSFEDSSFTYNPPITKEEAQKQEQKILEAQKQYEEKLQENKDKGLLNFQLYLSECIMRVSTDLKSDLTRELYDQCKSEYDKYLLEKGITYDSLNP